MNNVYRLNRVGGVLVAALLLPGLSLASTLETVKERGALRCGVNAAQPGFSALDDEDTYQGLDTDICRAVAAAALGEGARVDFVPLDSVERFAALQSGEVDVLARTTTWTSTRDTTLGLHFVGVSYFDGQAFMVASDLGVQSAKELDGAAVCTQSGTTSELNLSDYFRLNGMSFDPVVFDAPEQSIVGFEEGRCDVLSTDASQLYAQRVQLADPDMAVVLPEIISKEPLGPAVRQGDDQWFNIVKWSLFALLNAEELGVTQANVDDMLDDDSPDVMRLLGRDGDYGEGMGLEADWAYQIVKQVGNYAEVFERSVGAGSPFNIGRGLNALWRDGGLHYAPPIR
ncbi:MULTISPECIES: amino acid ABC transporter substrate-binding protein [unclassified Halomonas]|uniref:amino acid ABC transporter substrate-binding protein n=1 Tax=unclassified Halomonas TaxID=2609666 RepID=UPI00209EA5D2|nr:MULTISPECIES: amino acid ABC transporter substrate-binding protein [unclassified Halomonas]MCP1313958.1 amino acid ABC transporter substrate-binding protein [Halomonas sp. 707D7]MCP1325159.1 amino acid ABC transporter substrate-binding protein [Halomonas sp. 707D4]